MAVFENDFTVIFDGFDLNSINYVHLVRRFPNAEADTELTAHKIIRGDGSVVTATRREAKTIAFEGYIIAPSRTAMEEAFDELKYQSSGVNRTLLIQQTGKTRKYLVSKQNILIEHIEGGRARINLAFLSSSPYGSDDTLTTHDETVTGSPTGIDHTFGGTASALPVFTLVVNSFTGSGTKHIGIGNSSTGQQIQVSREWSTDDKVVFNLRRKEVYVNDAVSDYEGVFPEFRPNRSNAYYYDDLSARNVSLELYYESRYL